MILPWQILQTLKGAGSRCAGSGAQTPLDRKRLRQFTLKWPGQRLALMHCTYPGGGTVTNDQQAQARPFAQLAPARAHGFGQPRGARRHPQGLWQQNRRQ
jgi:hypothetical protein